MDSSDECRTGSAGSQVCANRPASFGVRGIAMHQHTTEPTIAPVPVKRASSSWMRAFGLALIVGLAVIAVAGCGQRGGESGGTSDGGSEATGPSVGLVTDLGGLNDRSFNALANKGMEQAQKELGATGTVLESKSGADYEKNLGQFAQQKTGLTIGVGFLMGEAVKSVPGVGPLLGDA